MSAYREELEVALAAADAAAEVIRACYGTGLEVRRKADRSPVTDADVGAERAIRSVIAEAFPDDAFLGEETGRSGDSDRVWLVDPIDGTKSYVRGYPFFSSQIALCIAGEVVVGVSDAPVYGERAWAVRGGGALLDGEPIRVSERGELADATVSLGNIGTLASGPGWSSLASIVTAADRIRGYGDFLHYHLLASGRLELVIESDLSVLDVAALSLIVEEAGGRFTDLEGRRLHMDTRSAVASNGRLHHLAEGLV